MCPGIDRSEEELRQSDAQLRAMLNAAFDAIVTMDAEGMIIGVNPAAETLFGTPADELVGREVAEAIIPPHLREPHREGLKRYIETRATRVSGHPVMLTAMRADGTEFPVELAIRRLEIPGPPVFTGFIRDLTARLAAEAEVAASRARLVTAHTTERRRLERNLHDGAQQRLVALALRLRFARRQLETAPERVGAELDSASEELSLALSELREISRGLHPAILTDHGLEAAITSVCSRATVPVDVDVEVSADPAEPLQAAAYYVVAEALTNVAKYACASSASVSLRAAGRHLSVDVRDDGVGGADRSQGSGLRGLADRVEALGGRLEIESPPGEGTRIRAELPLETS